MVCIYFMSVLKIVLLFYPYLSIIFVYLAMSSSLTGYALVTACRAEVTIYMKENNLKGYYILTGMAKV